MSDFSPDLPNEPDNVDSASQLGWRFVSEEEAVARVALTGLLTIHERFLRGYARKLSNGHDADAAEAYGELNLKLWERRQLFQPEFEWRPWACVILRNVVRERWRRTEAWRRAFSELVNLTPLSFRERLGEEFVDADFRAAFERNLQRLSPTAQLVVRLHGLSGMTFQEAADTLGIPLGATTAAFYHALRKLRGWMNPGGAGLESESQEESENTNE